MKLTKTRILIFLLLITTLFIANFSSLALSEPEGDVLYKDDRTTISSIPRDKFGRPIIRIEVILAKEGCWPVGPPVGMAYYGDLSIDEFGKQLKEHLEEECYSTEIMYVDDTIVFMYAFNTKQDSNPLPAIPILVVSYTDSNPLPPNPKAGFRYGEAVVVNPLISDVVIIFDGEGIEIPDEPTENYQRVKAEDMSTLIQKALECVREYGG